ncbi:anthranilate synthase component I [Actinobacillus equuli]|nr:anthranilate synthase component I [Actinobacillus equuli]
MNLNTQQTQLPYYEDTTVAFYHLCDNKPHTLLLDSAEIHSKNSLKAYYSPNPHYIFIAMLKPSLLRR